jgi:hypothetical protein
MIYLSPTETTGMQAMSAAEIIPYARAAERTADATQYNVVRAFLGELGHAGEEAAASVIYGWL